MLCERCKMREANIRYTEVINGVKTEHNLCSQCAKEMDFGHYTAMFDTDFPIGKLLSGLLGFDTEKEEKKEENGQVVCPTCHTPYSEFVKDSRFGCPDCYNVFDLLINDNIKQLQGNTLHTGKRPKFGWQEGEQAEESKEREWMEKLEILNSHLQEAIMEEEYEMAAKYRDQIKELKERMGADA